jgi:hypothetical protein
MQYLARGTDGRYRGTSSIRVVGYRPLSERKDSHAWTIRSPFKSAIFHWINVLASTIPRVITGIATLKRATRHSVPTMWFRMTLTRNQIGQTKMENPKLPANTMSQNNKKPAPSRLNKLEAMSRRQVASVAVTPSIYRHKGTHPKCHLESDFNLIYHQVLVNFVVKIRIC